MVASHDYVAFVCVNASVGTTFAYTVQARHVMRVTLYRVPDDVGNATRPNAFPTTADRGVVTRGNIFPVSCCCCYCCEGQCTLLEIHDR